MKNKNELSQVEIEEQHVRFFLKRIKPFLDKYDESENFKRRDFPKKRAEQFSLLDLCLAIYLQGLRDANETIKTKNDFINNE